MASRKTKDLISSTLFLLLGLYGISPNFDQDLELVVQKKKDGDVKIKVKEKENTDAGKTR